MRSALRSRVYRNQHNNSTKVTFALRERATGEGFKSWLGQQT